jgi:hypothetical protein
MALHFLNLDARTRQLMIEEVNRDVQNGLIYISPRLNSTGQSDYVTLLAEAAGAHDDAWLAGEINRGRLNAMEAKRTPSGGTTMAKVP